MEILGVRNGRRLVSLSFHILPISNPPPIDILLLVMIMMISVLPGAKYMTWRSLGNGGLLLFHSMQIIIVSKRWDLKFFLGEFEYTTLNVVTPEREHLLTLSLTKLASSSMNKIIHTARKKLSSTIPLLASCLPSDLHSNSLLVMTFCYVRRILVPFRYSFPASVFQLLLLDPPEHLRLLSTRRMLTSLSFMALHNQSKSRFMSSKNSVISWQLFPS